MDRQAEEAKFCPALLVIDFQEDFCPPNGSLAVSGGRDIANTINELLNMSFRLKVATQDWHPQDHISFASNHQAPNNKPFESMAKIRNPLNPAEVQTTRLWPDHCIQNTPGAKLIPELDQSLIDHIVKKGQDKRVEMYSAFKDPFKEPCVSESNLLTLLKEASISDVYVVGLATDYCVKESALHAAEAGYATYIINQGTRAVDQSEEGIKATKYDLESQGVKFVDVSGSEVSKVKQIK